MVFRPKTLLSLSVFLSACSSPSRPPLDVKFWYGDSKTQALVRRIWEEPEETLSTSNTKFDSYIALSSSDFAQFFKLFVLGCDKWKKEGFELTDDEQKLLDSTVKGN